MRSGSRYWIPDGYSFGCFKNQGAPGPDILPSYVLDTLPDTGQQARCVPPAATFEGHIVQWDGDTNPQKTAWLVRSGSRYWIPDGYSFGCFKNQGAPGPDILPSYVLDTLPDTGQQAQCVPPPSTFEGHIVQWDGDTNPQKTAWLVRSGKRYWIPDASTYNCLKSNGAPGPDVLPSYVLNSLPDQGGSNATCGGSQPIFGVMNTSSPPPDGVWFRNSPHNADTDRVTGHGVYANEQVRLYCYGWGDAVGAYNSTLWYSVANVSRPTINGRPNSGWLNAHYVNDGLAASQIDAGVPPC